jgi:hypothetical protein
MAVSVCNSVDGEIIVDVEFASLGFLKGMETQPWGCRKSLEEMREFAVA